MADLCERAGADVQEVALGIGLDNRIGRKFLNAGPGFGGSCFPKDLTALLQTAHDFGAPCRILETVAGVNDQRKRAMARKVIAACGGSVRGATIAVLGLTFKPNTDDMREAPSIALITALQDAGAKVRAYDPQGMRAARAVLQNVAYAEHAYACMDGADALVIATEWDEFRALDLQRVKATSRAPRHRRPAQHLQGAGHGETRVHLRRRRSRRRAGRAGNRRMSDTQAQPDARPRLARLPGQRGCDGRAQR